MFGKGGFEVNFRTTPNQSIRGASKGESKEELLRRAQVWQRFFQEIA